MENEFILACKDGNINEAQMLLQNHPNINISVYDEYAFRWACMNGHLLVAQWLLSVKPTIDISIYENFAFKISCQKGHLHVAEWLRMLMPFKFVIQTNNDNKPNPIVLSYKEAHKLAIITMFEKTGYTRVINAELLCAIIK